MKENRFTLGVLLGGSLSTLVFYWIQAGDNLWKKILDALSLTGLVYMMIGLICILMADGFFSRIIWSFKRISRSPLEEEVASENRVASKARQGQGIALCLISLGILGLVVLLSWMGLGA